MRKKMIGGAAVVALCLAGAGVANAEQANPDPASLPHDVTYYEDGSACEVGPINTVCFFTGKDFTGDALGIPHGVDDVELNGRWHFQSAKALNGLALGIGPTDGASMAACMRWAEGDKVVQWANLEEETPQSSPFSVVGHYKATTPSLSGNSAAVDCSNLDEEADADGFMRKSDEL